MAHTVTCADTGAACPGEFTTEDKDELVKHVEMHAEAAHPELELTAEMVDSLIKTT